MPLLQGVPHQIKLSMVLNCDLRDKSENLKRMNHFEKFNKANKKFVSLKMLDFSRILQQIKTKKCIIVLDKAKSLHLISL